MISDPYRVISLCVLLFCQTLVWAGEVVALKDCEVAMTVPTPERYSSSARASKAILGHIIDESYSRAIGVIEHETQVPTNLVRDRIVEIFKTIFEMTSIAEVKVSGENLARYSGRILTTAELVQAVAERQRVRLLRPYLDLRVRELGEEIAATASSAQKYALALRQNRLREAIAKYASWAATRKVHIDWDL